uniref:Uncharacterized protein n=1 Tax=Timema poppense TaxID=170557 RepID=A0A7R9CYM0_TIMPO|nr:unnamed protein product [Timema poppensis]
MKQRNRLLHYLVKNNLGVQIISVECTEVVFHLSLQTNTGTLALDSTLSTTTPLVLIFRCGKILPLSLLSALGASHAHPTGCATQTPRKASRRPLLLLCTLLFFQLLVLTLYQRDERVTTSLEFHRRSRLNEPVEAKLGFEDSHTPTTLIDRNHGE